MLEPSQHHCTGGGIQYSTSHVELRLSSYELTQHLKLLLSTAVFYCLVISRYPHKVFLAAVLFSLDQEGGSQKATLVVVVVVVISSLRVQKSLRLS